MALTYRSTVAWRRSSPNVPAYERPGAWDGFELAVRAILGQQVSVATARRLAEQLVIGHGERVSTVFASEPRLTHLFPNAQSIARAKSIKVGIPIARKSALQQLAQASLSDPDLFHRSGTIEEAIASLRKIRGVGEWTAQYIALRALRETDAFPAADVALLRGAELMDGTKLTVPLLLARSEHGDLGALTRPSTYGPLRPRQNQAPETITLCFLVIGVLEPIIAPLQVAHTHRGLWELK